MILKRNFPVFCSFYSRVQFITSDPFFLPETLSFEDFGSHNVSFSTKVGAWLSLYRQKFLFSWLSFLKWLFNNSDKILSFLQLLSFILTSLYGLYVFVFLA